MESSKIHCSSRALPEELRSQACIYIVYCQIWTCIRIPKNCLSTGRLMRKAASTLLKGSSQLRLECSSRSQWCLAYICATVELPCIHQLKPWVHQALHYLLWLATAFQGLKNRTSVSQPFDLICWTRAAGIETWNFQHRKLCNATSCVNLNCSISHGNAALLKTPWTVYWYGWILETLLSSCDILLVLENSLNCMNVLHTCILSMLLTISSVL